MQDKIRNCAPDDSSELGDRPDPRKPRECDECNAAQPMAMRRETAREYMHNLAIRLRRQADNLDALSAAMPMHIPLPADEALLELVLKSRGIA